MNEINCKCEECSGECKQAKEVHIRKCPGYKPTNPSGGSERLPKARSCKNRVQGQLKGENR